MALPNPTNVPHTGILPALPTSWSALTWQQLCVVLRFGIMSFGNKFTEINHNKKEEKERSERL